MQVEGPTQGSEKVATLEPSGVAPPYQGTCFGLEVHSALPFRYLREGTGSTVEVREVGQANLPLSGQELQTWAAVPGRRTFTRLHRDGSGAYTVSVGERHKYWLNPDLRLIATTPAKAAALREMLLWTTPAALAVTCRGDLALHAASVEIGGQALLLAASSGSGKSSTAAAFHAAGHRLLSDDFACVHLREEAGPEVRPGPAVLRLYSEVSDYLDLEDLAPAYTEGSKLHLELPTRRRGSGDTVPLAGIVFLEVVDGKLSLERVSGAEAVSRLWGLSFFLPDEVGRKQCFESLVAVANSVPVWRMARRLEWKRLPEILDRLITEVGP